MADKYVFKMTLEQYIQNPAGMKSNVAMNLKSVQNDLDLRYERLIQNKKNFTMKVYKKDENTVWVHVLVPSESYNMKYDVVIEVDITGDILKNQLFKVFSNSPSFVFNMAYVFNTYGLFVKELSSKYNNEVLSKPPIQKNTFGIISYEKSIYYAIVYLLTKYDTTDKLLKKAEKLNIKEFIDNISTEEGKIAEYTKKRKAFQRAKKKNVIATMADKIVKEQRKKESRTNTKATGGSNKISGKSKLKGKAKIKGKKKIR